MCYSNQMKWFCFFSALLALLPRLAAWEYIADFYFSENFPLCYNYTALPVKGTPAGEQLAVGEVIRVALVQDTREDTESSLPFSVDAAGELVPAEGLTKEQMQWCDLYVAAAKPDSQTWRTITQNGIPEGTRDGGAGSQVYMVKASCSAAFPEVSDEDFAVYVNYLVALDTRAGGTGACSGLPARVSRFAVSRGIDVSFQPVGASYAISVGYKGVNAEGIALPGCAVSEDFSTFRGDTWQPAVPLPSPGYLLRLVQAGYTPEPPRGRKAVIPFTLNIPLS